VEVFDEHAHRLPLGLLEQPAEQRFERLLALVLGGETEWRIACRQRQREKGRPQRHRLL
jgi:hypothetical protein